jgi:Ca2+-binding RTX toxin-like protein
VFGNSGNDTLLGNTGDDWLYGGAGDDKVYAGTGNDTVLVSSGQDSYWGGEGFDEIDFSEIAGKVSIDLSRHTATVSFGKTAVTDFLSGFETVRGSNAGTTFFGDNGDTRLFGGDSADYFRGKGGDDILRGGEGRDIFSYMKKDTAGGAVDLIRDFEVGADRLDMKDFLKGRAGPGDAVRFIDADGDAVVQGHTKAGWVDVVVLSGVAAQDLGYEILT